MIVAQTTIHNHFTNELIQPGDDATDYFNQLSPVAQDDFLQKGAVKKETAPAKKSKEDRKVTPVE